jgi:hypothetical protein
LGVPGTDSEGEEGYKAGVKGSLLGVTGAEAARVCRDAGDSGPLGSSSLRSKRRANGEELEDLSDGLSGLPLERRITGEEAVLGYAGRWMFLSLTPPLPTLFADCEANLVAEVVGLRDEGDDDELGKGTLRRL